jgi:hypothetical protein
LFQVQYANLYVDTESAHFDSPDRTPSGSYDQEQSPLGTLSQHATFNRWQFFFNKYEISNLGDTAADFFAVQALAKRTTQTANQRTSRRPATRQQQQQQQQPPQQQQHRKRTSRETKLIRYDANDDGDDDVATPVRTTRARATRTRRRKR